MRSINLKLYRLTIAFLGLLCASGVFASASHASAATKPNFVLIRADDLGRTDLASYGSKLYEAPKIDRLAADGGIRAGNHSACTVGSGAPAALLASK